ncbi:RNA-directed DNA polymerase from mobile element jockey [Eumeta japonica]|uniref:RNA-directed DNA polymerase from mobile element jockey n=1 Tax=Eumeta variegata TaxID=151549 RepID=A0A4C1WD79_EUMVA|nr:RNA-directed DNA polymerase from mobile element jockey [Eumeta japonica]
MVRLGVDSLSTKHPNLKMLDANIPWQRNYKYLGVTLDKNLHFRDHIERVRNTALFYKARLGAMLGRKSKLSRRNKRTIYKMCIRTVMTYASPVFAHAARKHYIDYSQVIDLSSLLHPAAANRSGRAGGREPTRDGFLRHPMPRRLPPGVVHSACHAPSALACAVRPHSVKLSKSSDLSSDSSRPTK